MRHRAVILFVLALYAGPVRLAAQVIPAKDMPRMKGARLLVGYPPWIYAITTEGETLVLKPEIKHPSVWYFLPSLSRSGSLVAGFRWKDNISEKILQVATYSIAENKWNIYEHLAAEGSVAISPDASKVAYIAAEHGTNEKGDNLYIQRVHILNLNTGREVVGPEAGPEPVNLSWSPDGKRLVYCAWGVEIWDLETNQHWKVVEGQMPAWSPDGQWIAYFELLPPAYSSGWQECMVIHPDGTGAKTLVKLPHGSFLSSARLFLEPPIWSPDSKKILLNEMANGEKWTMHIDLLDAATGKLKRIMKNKVPVYAWAEAK